MQESVEAIYENGVFRPLTGVSLPEGRHVHLAVWPVEDYESDPAFNLTEIAEETGVVDLATNIDHYLYGLPKQTERSDEQAVR